MGIGSLLGIYKPDLKTRRIHIFGSGLGYGQFQLPVEKCNFIGVRGPLTCKTLGLDEKKSISDPGLLIKELSLPNVRKKFPFSYMPHHSSVERFPFEKELIGELGINYINPSDDPNSIITELIASEVLITEALHGAIAADALQIPWVPVKTVKGIKDFKWLDYCLSVGHNLEFNCLPSLYSPEYLIRRCHEKFGLRMGLLWRGYAGVQPQLKFSAFKRKMRELMGKRPYLLDEKTLGTTTERQLQCLSEQVKTLVDINDL